MELPTQEIKVVNRVPKVLLGVIREQFNLMQGWLAPLAEAAKSQRADIVYLKERLEAVLQQYQDLLTRMENANRD